jgi:uroporphyrinogen-III decarboxylase
MDGEEYVVPPLHGPEDFRDFNLRYDQPLIDLIHEGGGLVHIHCHGSLRKVLPMFVEMGVDVLHPVEAPPMGDTSPGDARRITGGRVCLEGNIQIAAMYEEKPAEIREQVRALVAEAFVDRRNLIVSPTASPYIPGAGGRCLPQYEAMLDAVLEWRP